MFIKFGTVHFLDKEHLWISRWRSEEHGGTTVIFGIIAHGGSSSPGLCIFHTDAEGAPYSGLRRPGRQASPKASEIKKGIPVISF